MKSKKSAESKIVVFLGDYWPLLAYILISVIFLFPIFRQQGVPLKYDWGWPLFSVKQFWSGLFLNGSLGIASIIGKYAQAILGLPGVFNISPSISLKIFLLLAHVCAGYGFFLLAKNKIESKFVAFVTGLAYAFSPYIFIRTIIGFTYSIVAYAVLPIFLIIYFIAKKNFWQYLLSALLLSLIFSQFQAGVLTVLFLIIHLIFTANKVVLKNFLLTISSLAILILPWFIVGLIHGSSNSVPTGSEVVTLKFIADLPHSLRNVLMLSDHSITVSYFYPFSRKLIIVLGFGLAYLVAVLSIFDRKNRSLTLGLILSSVLILPFTVGPTGKFTSLYTFVFNHFPQIALFRETYHFEFLLSFALIFLFAIGANQILSWLQSKRLVSIATKLLVVFVTFIIILPYLTFNYAGYFHLQQIPEEYRQAQNFLSSNKNFCTKAYYPLNLGFVYFKDDKTADAANSDLIASAFGISYLTDGASVLTPPSGEMYFRNRLSSQFLEKSDNGEVASLMQNGGADCLIVRTDLETKYDLVSGLWLESDQSIRDKWYNRDLLGLAKSKKGLVDVKDFGDKIHIFKISNDKAQIPNQIQNSNIETVQQYKNPTILPITDWASEFDKYQDGWSRGRYAFWRKKIFADLQQDFIYTTKNGAVLSHQAVADESGDLVIRYLDGGVGGSFQLQISNSKFQISKQSGDEKFIVKDLGEVSVKKGDTITITNISGENAIADIVLVEK